MIFTACSSGETGLDAIHTQIAKDYPQVSHISAAQLSQLNAPIYLDIRETEEFAVSHLAGAIQIDPNADIRNVLSKVGDVSGRDVVVYCSVGRRSSSFAARLQETLTSQGASRVSNLENGIFGWHNDERPLMDAAGETKAIHPYNSVWKRYVRHKDKTRYVPISQK